MTASSHSAMGQHPDDLQKLIDEWNTSAAPAEQPPAVGGDTEAWLDSESGAIITDELKTLLCEERYDVALGRVAPLLAEIEAVKFNLDKTDKLYLAAVAEIERLNALLECSKGDIRQTGKIMDQQRIRIAELEAQQGEPVAWAFDVEGYDPVIIDDHQRALYEQRFILDRGRTATISALYREAKPATAKVMLPERMVKTDRSSDEYDMCADAHNACLDEVVRPNEPSP